MRVRIHRARAGSRFLTAGPRAAARRRRVVGAPATRAICGEGDDALGRRRLHPEQRAGDDLDALGRLVARRLELEHALHLAQARLLLARARRARSRAPPCARAARGARRRRSPWPRPRASTARGRRRRGGGSSVLLRSTATRGAARSFALRDARVLLLLLVGRRSRGFFVSGCPAVRRGRRASRAGPRANGS